jgi:hypothetical protein
MKLVDAIEIVLNLARENALEPTEDHDPELEAERLKQLEALNTVEDFAVNHLGEE